VIPEQAQSDISASELVALRGEGVLNVLVTDAQICGGVPGGGRGRQNAIPYDHFV
jgi:hypothetical protein